MPGLLMGSNTDTELVTLDGTDPTEEEYLIVILSLPVYVINLSLTTYQAVTVNVIMYNEQGVNVFDDSVRKLI